MQDDHFGYATQVWIGLINMQFAAGLSIVSVKDGNADTLVSFYEQKKGAAYTALDNLMRGYDRITEQ